MNQFGIVAVSDSDSNFEFEYARIPDYLQTFTERCERFIRTKVSSVLEAPRLLSPGQRPTPIAIVHDCAAYTYIFDVNGSNIERGDVVFGIRHGKYDFLLEIESRFTTAYGKELNFSTYSLNPDYNPESLPPGFWYNEETDRVQVPQNFRIPLCNVIANDNAFDVFWTYFVSEGDDPMFKDKSGQKLPIQRIYELRFKHLPKQNIWRQLFYKLIDPLARLSERAQQFLE